MTQPLSSAAQAVFWAFNSKFDWIEDGVPGPQFRAISAALRALADRVVPADGSRRNNEIRAEILAIAANLEAASFEEGE